MPISKNFFYVNVNTIIAQEVSGMSDRMTPIPFGTLMNWILADMKDDKGIFGVRFPYRAKGAALDFIYE